MNLNGIMCYYWIIINSNKRGVGKTINSPPIIENIITEPGNTN
jgi:hypothetical protein